MARKRKPKRRLLVFEEDPLPIDGMADRSKYDEPVEFTTEEDRLADLAEEFAGLEQDEAAQAYWVWPPKSRKSVLIVVGHWIECGPNGMSMIGAPHAMQKLSRSKVFDHSWLAARKFSIEDQGDQETLTS